MNYIDYMWERILLHEKYPNHPSKLDIDQNITHQWLQRTGQKGKIVGLVIAEHNQILCSRNYHENALKIRSDLSCRICGNFTETIDHDVSGCQVLTEKEYFIRYDRLG